MKVWPLSGVDVGAGATLAMHAGALRGAYGWRVALERVHRTRDTEHFGPVRLGPQDLRDIAAVFADLDGEAPPTLPVFKTEFNTGEHKTNDVEDLLAYPDADTLAAIHVVSAEVRLSFHAARSGTTIYRSEAMESDATVRRAVDKADARLRAIIASRELSGLAALRQTGPDKWGMIGLLVAPVPVTIAAVSLLGRGLSAAAANAGAWGVLFLCYVPLLVLSGKSRDLVRLRGPEHPWWERRTGLVGLVGLVLGIVVPFVIYGLEGRRG